jgi:xylulokinase
MVLLGDGGRVLRSAKLWNDTESAPQAAELVERLGAAAWAQRTGSVPVAAFTITKLAWVAVHEPDVLAATGRVMLPHDWLTFRLTGAHVTDRGDASGSGWWSPSTGAPDPQLLELVDPTMPWAEMVPTVLGHDAAAGAITPEAARDLGLPPTCRVGPGTGDNMAAALGLGLGAGDVVMSLGTSGTAYAVSEVPTADPTGAVAGFADATGRFLPLVCTLNATKVTDAVASLMGLDAAGLSSLALAAPPGANSLVLVPYLDGERTPNLPDATGIVQGLRTSTSRADLARSAHEGVVCGLLAGVDALEAAGVALDGNAFLVGGGSRSGAYRRIVADLWARPVCVPDDDEVVATGACVQAAMIATGADAADLAGSWGLGRGSVVVPTPGIDAGGIRARYAAASRLSS